mmetsp:Transcript_9921/g.30435  ORF Transcript_9921/g.30435 Transcript_9921/m.30435 type:complete len:80 (-) Transcript_9921:1722-1961(-)
MQVKSESSAAPTGIAFEMQLNKYHPAVSHNAHIAKLYVYSRHARQGCSDRHSLGALSFLKCSHSMWQTSRVGLAQHAPA